MQQNEHRLSYIAVLKIYMPSVLVINIFLVARLFSYTRKRLLFQTSVPVCPSVFPHVSTRLPLDGLTWNSI